MAPSWYTKKIISRLAENLYEKDFLADANKCVEFTTDFLMFAGAVPIYLKISKKENPEIKEVLKRNNGSCSE